MPDSATSIAVAAAALGTNVSVVAVVENPPPDALVTNFVWHFQADFQLLAGHDATLRSVEFLRWKEDVAAVGNLEWEPKEESLHGAGGVSIDLQ